MAISSRTSPIESARFGITTARVSLDHSPTDLDDLAPELAGVLAAIDADLVIVRMPSSSLGLIARAGADEHWSIMPAGTLMYWEWDREVATAAAEAAAPDGEDHRAHADVHEAPLDTIRSIILDSFDGYLNHYAANPELPPGIATVGYAEWTDQLLLSDRGRRFDVLADDGSVVGAAIVGIDDGMWDIHLAGIVSGAQRRGYYRSLIRSVERAALAASAVNLVISTQTHNIAVQRAWASLGWRPVSAVDTVHLRRRSSAPANR